MGFHRFYGSESTVLVNKRKAIASRMCGRLSAHWPLTEQLPHDLSSFYRAVPLGYGIKLLCHPAAGTEERVARYLGRRPFRCFVDEHDLFSRQPFRLDQFTVFSIVPVIDPCLRHVDSPNNDRSRHLLERTADQKKNPSPVRAASFGHS